MAPPSTSKTTSFFRLYFDGLNLVALIGWIYVAVVVCTTPSETLFSRVARTVGKLEVICIVEVVRIAIGNLPGNLVLGVILHAIRVLALTQILPRNKEVWLATAVLGSWAITEISRYPMYVFKSSKQARLLRMVVPVVSFPIGCGAEALSAWLVFWLNDTPAMVRVGLLCLMGINVLLGPTMAYPIIVKKALKELRNVKSSRKND